MRNRFAIFQGSNRRTPSKFRSKHNAQNTVVGLSAWRTCPTLVPTARRSRHRTVSSAKRRAQADLQPCSSQHGALLYRSQLARLVTLAVHNY